MENYSEFINHNATAAVTYCVWPDDSSAWKMAVSSGKAQQVTQNAVKFE